MDREVGLVQFVGQNSSPGNCMSTSSCGLWAQEQEAIGIGFSAGTQSWSSSLIPTPLLAPHLCACVSQVPQPYTWTHYCWQKREQQPLVCSGQWRCPDAQGGKACINDLETRAPARGRISAFIDGCGNEEHSEWSGLILCAHSWWICKCGGYQERGGE